MMSRQAASEDDFDLPMPGHLGHRNMRSWLISFVFHVGILLLLALYVLPGFSPRSVQSLKGSFASDDKLAPQFSIASATFGELTFDDEEIESPVQVPISPVIAQVTAGDLEHTEVIDPGSVKMLTSRSTVGVAKPSLRMVRPASGTRAIRRSTSMADAVSGVGDSIRGELLQGDTLVVWLLDASISLRDDRATMAWHARQLYESISSLAPRSDDAMDGHTLLSSVIAFGSGWQEIAKPMQDGSQAIDAMENVPIDTTGIENIMTAIDHVVELYRQDRGHRQRMLVVVLTDESGDDTEKLEDTIRGCRESGVAVHLIGPTAVMGLQQGWEHCAVRQGSVNYSFWLAVNRGPETPLPERLFFPYWHQSELPPWERPGARAVEAGQWYGGAYRERLLSGFGPYALTRLALQTGGSFTLFDAEWRGYGDGAYSLDVLRDYVPSYESSSEYLASVSRRPLRQFVVDAAAISLDFPRLFAPPRTTFMGQRSPYYPFNIERVHCAPSEFGGRLSVALNEERNRVQAASEKLADLIGRLQDPSINWDDEFAKEESKRWRAWFALTKGRLLATRARQLEYLAVTDVAASTLSSESNSFALLPSESLRVPASAALISEARACLARCIEDNPGTPWEEMAAWELAHPFGLRSQQARIPKPLPSTIAGQIRTPTTFTFPSL